MKKLCLIFIFGVGAVTASFAQQHVLKGLKQVEVVVEDLQNPEESGGVTREYLETIIELKLRQNGIKVIKDSETFIYLNLNIIRLTRKNGMFDGFVYNSSLQLKEVVLPYSDLDEEKIRVAASWDTSSLGFDPEPFIKTDIGELVKQQTDFFINDYLKANR